MIGWEEKTLNELGKVARGKSRHRPRNAPHLYGGNYPLIQTGDIEAAQFYLNSFTQTYSQAGLEQSKLWPKGTLCISIVGANTGASAILDFEACFPDSVIGFLSDPKTSDVKFVKYSLEILRSKLKSISEGAARENLSLEKLLTIKIPTPSLHTQRKIASILSTYDDLIENNLKRIKLLEEIVQRSFEEWFVKFRINGKQLPIDKKTGLPEGWERKKILDCNSFKQHKEKVKKFDGNQIYLATADVDGTQITGAGEVINWENKPSRAQIKLIKESVWFARMSNTYKIIITTSNFNKEFIISSGFAGFTPTNSYCLPFLFCLINSKDFHDKKDLFATGATQVSINDISLSSIEIIEPTINLIEDFGCKFLKVLELRQNLIDQKQLLKESRDILLPRLMSGVIEVK